MVSLITPNRNNRYRKSQNALLPAAILTILNVSHYKYVNSSNLWTFQTAEKISYKFTPSRHKKDTFTPTQRVEMNCLQASDPYFLEASVFPCVCQSFV
jgi:hypothetical protein